MKKPKNVDAYIAAAPKESRAMLKILRNIIKSAAPKAQEGISYGMPYYSYYGRLAYFAGHAKHVGFYPMSGVIRAFKKELRAFATSAGTVRFPIGKPLPASLIRRMVKARVKENEMRKRRA